MPSNDEINAAFDAVYAGLQAMIASMIPNKYVPFVGNLQDITRQKLASPDGRKALVKEVRDALVAAEKIRNQASKDTVK